MRTINRLVTCLFILIPAWLGAQYYAELVYFTVDGNQGSTPLLPGFRLQSCWSGLGAASNGNIYIGISNHYQPSQPSDPHGNVAMFKYDPAQDKISLLDDLKSASQKVNNWMASESQHKVHTFLIENADGRMYFATDDYEPTYFLRGAHVYYIDLATDQVVDFSKTQPNLMTRNFTVIPNPGTLGERSGVFIEYYGIKGISLNPQAPDLLYAMTYPEGHVIRYRFSDGTMKKVGQAPQVSYVFHTDKQGNAYYLYSDGSYLDLLKYSVGTDQLTTISENFTDVRNVNGQNTNEGFGMIAPTRSGDTVYCMTTAGSNYGGADLWRLIVPADSLEYVTSVCGTYTWRIFNMTLSPDGTTIYYVSISVDDNGTVLDNQAVYTINLATKECGKLFTIDQVAGDRGLCFGGVNTWDKFGNFYVPVWKFGTDPTNIALMKVHIGVDSRIADTRGDLVCISPGGMYVYPNPFTDQVTLKLVLSESRWTEVTLTDLEGRTVRSLGQGTIGPGPSFYQWDGTDDQNRPVDPGIYFCRVNGQVRQKLFYSSR